MVHAYDLHSLSPFSGLSAPRTCRSPLRSLLVSHLHHRTTDPDLLGQRPKVAQAWDRGLSSTFFKPPVTLLKKRFLQSLLLLPGIAFATSLQFMDLPSKYRIRTRSALVDLTVLGSLVPYLGTVVGHVREAPRPHETSNDAVFLTWFEKCLPLSKERCGIRIQQAASSQCEYQSRSEKSSPVRWKDTVPRKV